MEQKRKTVSPFSNEARNAYVVEHITDSFLTRLKEKPLTDISISELCDAAGVGRTSFYRNFDSREDIVRKYIRRLLTGWKHNWEAEGEESNAKMYGSLFQHLKENADLFLMLKTRGLMYLFLEVFMEIWGPRPEYENMWAYTTAFIAYGTYGWIEEWIIRGMQESSETMAELLVKNGMK